MKARHFNYTTVVLISGNENQERFLRFYVLYQLYLSWFSLPLLRATVVTIGLSMTTLSQELDSGKA